MSSYVNLTPPLPYQVHFLISSSAASMLIMPNFKELSYRLCQRKLAIPLMFLAEQIDLVSVRVACW